VVFPRSSHIFKNVSGNLPETAAWQPAFSIQHAVSVIIAESDPRKQGASSLPKCYLWRAGASPAESIDNPAPKGNNCAALTPLHLLKL
jgi:hypothetical protein